MYAYSNFDRYTKMYDKYIFFDFKNGMSYYTYGFPYDFSGTSWMYVDYVNYDTFFPLMYGIRIEHESKKYMGMYNAIVGGKKRKVDLILGLHRNNILMNAPTSLEKNIIALLNEPKIIQKISKGGDEFIPSSTSYRTRAKEIIDKFNELYITYTPRRVIDRRDIKIEFLPTGSDYLNDRKMVSAIIIINILRKILQNKDFAGTVAEYYAAAEMYI